MCDESRTHGSYGAGGWQHPLATRLATGGALSQATQIASEIPGRESYIFRKNHPSEKIRVKCHSRMPLNPPGIVAQKRKKFLQGIILEKQKTLLAGA